MSNHWLLFDEDRKVTGCHCGFRADMDSDSGYGDSVVEHLLAAEKPTPTYEPAPRMREAESDERKSA